MKQSGSNPEIYKLIQTFAETYTEHFLSLNTYFSNFLVALLALLIGN